MYFVDVINQSKWTKANTSESLSPLASRLQNDFAYKAAMLGCQDYLVSFVFCLFSLLITFVWCVLVMLGSKGELFVHFLLVLYICFLVCFIVCLLVWLKLTAAMLRNKSQFYMPFKLTLLSKISDLWGFFSLAIIYVLMSMLNVWCQVGCDY